MKIYLTALALTVMFATSAAAGSGNIAGSESRGQPINSTVRLPAIDPDTGYMPTMYQSGSKAKAQANTKKTKKKRAY